MVEGDAPGHVCPSDELGYPAGCAKCKTWDIEESHAMCIRLEKECGEAQDHMVRIRNQRDALALRLKAREVERDERAEQAYSEIERLKTQMDTAIRTLSSCYEEQKVRADAAESETDDADATGDILVAESARLFELLVSTRAKLEKTEVMLRALVEAVEREYGPQPEVPAMVQAKAVLEDK